MTLIELQSTKDFFTLYVDPRFVALLNYLREHPGPLEESLPNDPSAYIRNEGAWQGWFRILKRIEECRTAIPDNRQPASGLKYVKPAQPEPKQ